MSFHVQLNKRRKKCKDGSVAVYWTLRWRGTTGKDHSESVGKVGEMTKAQAETCRREKEAAMTAGTLRRDKPRPMTIDEFLKLDQERIKPDVKRNTLESHKHAGSHAKKAWGEETKLASIGPAHVARLKTFLLEEQKVSPATVAKTLRTLKAAFYRALREGIVHENPFKGVRMPKTQSRAKRIFSADETRAMREAVPSVWWKCFLVLGESSGFRKNELLNLQWRDIDFERKTVRVTGKREGTFKGPDSSEYPILPFSTKSYEDRSVPLPEQTMSLLAKLFAESDGSPYLFLPLERLAAIAGELANGPLGPNYELVNNMNRHFDYVQRQAREALAKEREVATEKVPWERGTIHDLRRTYGTRMSRIVPIHVLKEYMGHAKIQTTQEYYLAAEAEDADKARSGMEALLSKAAPQARTLRAPEDSEAKVEQSKNDESPGNAETSVNEADGTRTRNHRIDSPEL